MITILVAVALTMVAIGVIAGVLVFGIGMLGSALIIGLKIGLVLIPTAVAVLLVKALFGI